MMVKDFIRREWILWLALAAPVVYIAMVWNQIPAIIPTHFNASGQADDHGSKAFGTLLLPGMSLVIYFLLLVIPRIDPRYKNYAEFRNTFQAIRLVIHIFFSLLSISIVYTAMTESLLTIRLIPISAFLMIAMIGYFLPKVKSNFFVGIRTPWTLSNETVWRKTHEMGGRLMFYTGLAVCFLLFVIPMKYSLFIFFPAILIIAVVPVLYSYLEFRKIQRENK